MMKKISTTSENRFSPERLLEPGREYSPIYSWVWNAPITKKKTEKQLDEMLRLGVKAVYIIPEPKSFRPGRMPTLLDPDYLTEPYFEEYKYALKAAFDRGMLSWIYDEAGWPSGGACGKVLRENPSLARCFLASREKWIRKGEIYKSGEDVFATFDDNKQIESGFVADNDVLITEYYSHKSYFEDDPIPDFPDLTRAESTDAFINITHEKYKEHLEEFFGEHILAVFTDEPTAPRPTPFYSELVAEYEQKYGESIASYLPALLKEKTPTSEASEALIKWYDFVSDKLCNNFLLRTKKWCNENNLEFVGHMDLDNTPDGCMRGGNFHLMRSLRCFDVPGIDVIWRQIFPCEPRQIDDITIGENKFFPRYASSAAAQIGSKRALSETFGVYGNGLTPEQMRWVMGFQAIRGINLFNNMLISYGREGYLLAGELPSFREDYACYSDLKHFNEYAERLCYLTSLGYRKTDTAIYLSMRDIWAGINDKKVVSAFEKVGFELEESGMDFDIIDDDVISACNAFGLKDGFIEIGKAKYNTIVIPWCEYMPDKTQKLICDFIKGGGKVFLVDTPVAFDNSQKIDSCKNILSPALKFSSKNGSIRLQERVADNARIVLFFNEGFEKTEISINVGQEKGYIVDINCGQLSKIETNKGKISIALESGETSAIIFTDEDYETVTLNCNKTLNIDTPFTFHKTKQLVISNMEALMSEVEDSEKAVSLGDWRRFCGDDFSGSGVYKTEFELSDMVVNNALLDLGSVKHTAEVFLNGVSLGVKVMSPYTFEVNSDILKEQNVLEVRVSNSAANAFALTDLWSNFEKWQLSPYFDKQTEFDRDSLCGGLIGPVTLGFI